jgi:hypothetical protein
MEINPQSFAFVKGEIQQGDLLLFRGQGWLSRMISVAGRTNWTHAGMVDVWDGELYCDEVREFVGGRVVTLASQVERFPGQIDVFRANTSIYPQYDRQAAALHMRRFAGCSYGWWHVIGAAVLHVPVLRFRLKTDYSIEVASETGPTKPPYCSQAVSMACRLSGKVDPVPQLADRFTEPGDLSRSNLFDYQFTLSWP